MEALLCLVVDSLKALSEGKQIDRVCGEAKVRDEILNQTHKKE